MLCGEKTKIFSFSSVPLKKVTRSEKVLGSNNKIQSPLLSSVSVVKLLHGKKEIY
jgi:hypothetical protein